MIHLMRKLRFIYTQLAIRLKKIHKMIIHGFVKWAYLGNFICLLQAVIVSKMENLWILIQVFLVIRSEIASFIRQGFVGSTFGISYQAFPCHQFRNSTVSNIPVTALSRQRSGFIYQKNGYECSFLIHINMENIFFK